MNSVPVIYQIRRDPNAFEGPAFVFDGPEDFHNRIDDPELGITAHSILIMRGAGPIGYPGGAEVVNMRPPSYLIKQDVHAMPCIGDGRQSGTSGSASILNVSPEAAAGGNLAIIKDGDFLRVDLTKRTVMLQVSDEEIAKRRADLLANGGPNVPESPDTLAGNVPQACTPLLRRHGSGRCRQLSGYWQYQSAAPQPLSLRR